VEVTGIWRKVHTEELHNLYSSLNIKVIKSRKMRWVGHVAHLGEIINAYKTLVGKQEGKRLVGRPKHSRRIKLEWILKNWVGVDWIYTTQDRDQWQTCEHSNETSGSIKGENFLN
jgi:hypothetical protein